MGAAEVFAFLSDARERNVRGALAVVVAAEGSTYRRIGACAAFLETGETRGALSGGCVEGDLLAASAEVLSSGAPRVLDYRMSGEEDVLWGTGTGCAGRISVLLSEPEPALLAQVGERIGRGEGVLLRTSLAPGTLGRREALPLPPGAASMGGPAWFDHAVEAPALLVLCGAGDDARPVARLAPAAGFRVTVADHREAWLAPDRFPGARCVLVPPGDRLTDHVDVPASACGVVLAHHYGRDLEHLESLLDAGLGYVGLLGARERSRRLVADLLRKRPDLDKTLRASLRTPIGLDLGAEGPEEIALAIVAELLAYRRGHRSGRPLTEVRGPFETA